MSGPRLALYHRPDCIYCARVRRAIDALGLEVELRDVDRDPEHERALVAARGRARVPVLRIDGADASTEWLPESAEIVRWLELRAGRPPAPRWVGVVDRVATPTVPIALGLAWASDGPRRSVALGVAVLALLVEVVIAADARRRRSTERTASP